MRYLLDIAQTTRVPVVARITRAPVMVIALLLLALPFLFVAIPPLSDVPGHMGSSAAAVHAHDPAFARLMGYRWHLVPNLGTDLLVFALQPLLGLTRAYWLVTAAIPLLLGAGIFMLARTLNRDGAAAIGWALIFVYSFPFNYGFINYMFGVGLALAGFVAWIRLDRHPRAREAATWVWVPVVFLCHVVAGCLLVLFIGAREISGAPRPLALGRLAGRLRPLLSSVVILVLWRLDANSIAGQNHYSLGAKRDALVMLLRDQNIVLDIASVLLAAVVFVVGWRRGARPHAAVTTALAALLMLFVVTPYRLSGSSYADERLLPLIPMLAFATQDWSGVDRRLARLVAAGGLLLLGLRVGVTTAGFAAYDRRYDTELAALQAIAPYSRVVVLNMRDCTPFSHWRGNRLDHLSDLAIVARRSWINSEWDVDGGHLLQIRYRPSPRFYDDPSQYVWPASCGGVARRHPTLQDALAALPLDGIDDLWLLDTTLPPGYRNGRLAIRWHGGDSTLYAVQQTAHARP